jgi:hypothetical protein
MNPLHPRQVPGNPFPLRIIFLGLAHLELKSPQCAVAMQQLRIGLLFKLRPQRHSPGRCHLRLQQWVCLGKQILGIRIGGCRANRKKSVYVLRRLCRVREFSIGVDTGQVPCCPWKLRSFRPGRLQQANTLRCIYPIEHLARQQQSQRIVRMLFPHPDPAVAHFRILIRRVLIQQASQHGVRFKLTGIFRDQFFQRVAFQRKMIGKGHPIQQLRIEFPVDYVLNVRIDFAPRETRRGLGIEHRQ